MFALLPLWLVRANCITDSRINCLSLSLSLTHTHTPCGCNIDKIQILRNLFLPPPKLYKVNCQIHQWIYILLLGTHCVHISNSTGMQMEIEGCTLYPLFASSVCTYIPVIWPPPPSFFVPRKASSSVLWPGCFLLFPLCNCVTCFDLIYKHLTSRLGHIWIEIVRCVAHPLFGLSRSQLSLCTWILSSKV